jgi:hypothetical protein
MFEIHKPIKDIQWDDLDTDMPVSEPLVMRSAAGWYVGMVCKDPACGGWIVPYFRGTGYYATAEEAAEQLPSL